MGAELGKLARVEGILGRDAGENSGGEGRGAGGVEGQLDADFGTGWRWWCGG